MKKIYIAGPMTGYEDWNFPSFHSAALELRTQGYEVINPAEIDSDQTDWSACMRADIKQLCDCNIIYMLKDWEFSTGATLEFTIADALGMEIMYEQE